ncbi:hypothetical protein PQX77_009129 [Marasmius sp. AFHP31]|nr:hypothetical protein PQX77_009129 [Marasmius sp. AFHP31]
MPSTLTARQIFQRQKTKPARTIPCPIRGCSRFFARQNALSNHLNVHRDLIFSSSEEDNGIAHSDSESPSASDEDPPDNPIFDDLDGGEPEGHQPPGRDETSPPPVTYTFHEYLNARRCDSEGNFLPENAPPPPEPTPHKANNWFPWSNGLEFRVTNLLYRKMQSSAGHIDELAEIITALTHEQDAESLFGDSRELYSTIDMCPNGSVPWEAVSVSYDGPRLPGKTEPWMDKDFTVYFRNPREVLHQQLSNPDFERELETTPYRAHSTSSNLRQYRNFMSGNWATREADQIIKDHPDSEGAMLCPVIIGSDKTTVSVATGQNDYYPAYLSNGNLTNNARRAHKGGVSLFMFLAIPKTDRSYQDSAEFRRFRRHLFHQSLRHVFEHLRPYMTSYDVVKLSDGYYRRVIYSLGPYIGDYPEQVLLACIVQGWCARCTAPHDDLDGPGVARSHEHTVLVQEAMSAARQWDDYGVISGILPFTHSFPRADIHASIAPDILHQLIKGTFKDHLVTWVQEYLKMYSSSKAEAARIMADIDRRIAAAPLFPELRRFPEGCGFKQWTGNDSKALMKVYLPAIAGHVPDGVVRTLAAFIEVCYLIRRDVHSEDTIREISRQIDIFHAEREVFKDLDVKDTFSLPRQHSLSHYPQLIAEFGLPNGLCSSITESKHISAVKEPWRRSSRNTPLAEMLVINNRMDKMQWAEVDFRHRGMLTGPPTLGLSAEFATQADLYATELTSSLTGLAANPSWDDEDDDGGPVDGNGLSRTRLAKKHIPNLPRHPVNLEQHLNLKNFTFLLRCFLHQQRLPPDYPVEDLDWGEIEDDLPVIDSHTTIKVKVFPSAVSTFSAPSDLCGFGGMKRERIRAVESWKNSGPRHDCVFMVKDQDGRGFRSLHVARVVHFLSIEHDHEHYECALISGFTPISDEPDPVTGLWIVKPDEDDDGDPQMDIVSLDTIVRGAHLMGVCGKERLPNDFTFYDDYLNSQVESQEWNAKLHESLGASMYATPRATPKALVKGRIGSPSTPSASNIKHLPTKGARTTVEEHVPQKLESTPEPELHLLSATEIKILGLEDDLKRAQRNFTELSQRHSNLIDKQSEELSAMEQQVLDREVENKIITTARRAERKEWARRVASLETDLTEQKAAVSRLRTRVRKAEQDRDEALVELSRYRICFNSFKTQLGSMDK